MSHQESFDIGEVVRRALKYLIELDLIWKDSILSFIKYYEIGIGFIRVRIINTYYHTVFGDYYFAILWIPLLVKIYVL